MKQKRFRLACLVLAAALLLGGCGTIPEPEHNASDAAANSTHTYPYTVTDQAGRTVTIEKKYTRVAFSSVRPLPAAYFAVVGNIDALVGMNPSSRSAAMASMFYALCPEIAEVETGFITGNDTNIEELMRLNPEVVFCLNTNTDELNALEAAGITAVGLETNGTDAVELFAQWAELIGQVMGEENRAEALIEESRKVAAEIKSIGQTIPEAEKKRVLIIYQNTGTVLQAAGSQLYSQYWLESVGAINAAADVQGVAEVSMEQIMVWDPEIILLTNFTAVQPEDLYGNTISGQDWSGIRAVREGNVYKIPLGIYRWFTPTADASLMLKWAAQTIYPDYYNHYNIEEDVRAHYETYYGCVLSDEELDMIFHPSSDAAYYAPKTATGN